ncbi:NTP transferase domain-containing protein [Streptomyces sp. NPDC049954]|uniref:nucleotidyltransferase family protein n=1 Tax=Streptomyces sp. NPDC049954 TaxID=3155779 RepID=UPI00343B81D9
MRTRTRGAVVGVLLAAGGGRRLGGRPKALLRGGGLLLVERGVAALRDGGCARVHVVLGARSHEVRRRVEERSAGTDGSRHGVTGLAESVTWVENPLWESGMGSSLRAGLTSLDGTGAGAALICLVDQPGIGAAAVARVARAYQGSGSLACAAYEGRRGHPVLLGADRWPAVAASAVGDRGARGYLREREAELTLVECGDVAQPYDIDTAADLGRLDTL